MSRPLGSGIVSRVGLRRSPATAASPTGRVVNYVGATKCLRGSLLEFLGQPPPFCEIDAASDPLDITAPRATLAISRQARFRPAPGDWARGFHSVLITTIDPNVWRAGPGVTAFLVDQGRERGRCRGAMAGESDRYAVGKGGSSFSLHGTSIFSRLSGSPDLQCRSGQRREAKVEELTETSPKFRALKFIREIARWARARRRPDPGPAMRPECQTLDPSTPASSPTASSELASPSP
jgi:hypothetical protein